MIAIYGWTNTRWLLKNDSVISRVLGFPFASGGRRGYTRREVPEFSFASVALPHIGK
jgi:hypothetical protein